MRFYAGRAIEPNEEITISYLERPFGTSRAVRRFQLLLEKRFYCRCSRCCRCSRAGAGHAVAHAVAHAPSSESGVAASVAALFAMECAAASCASASCPHGQPAGTSPSPRPAAIPLPAACGDIAVFMAEHPPCPELAGEAVTAFLASSQLGKAGGGASAQLLARWISARYLPWARLQFGEQDGAVRAMVNGGS